MKVTLLYSPAPRQVREWTLELLPGTSVAQALENCQISIEFPELRALPPVVGVWGKRVNLKHLLLAGERVEIYRALRVDPKIARRERFNSQGAKTAGLFSRTRAGAKAGY